MEPDEINKLARKYTEQSASQEDRARLETWYLESVKQSEVSFEGLDFEQKHQEIWKGILERAPSASEKRVIKLYSARWISIAASLIVLFGISWYLMGGLNFWGQHDLSSDDIAPGGNIAYLTLSDGRRVSLAKGTDAVLEKESDVQISKSQDGQLVYHVKPGRPAGADQKYNVLETPKGGQYQLVLPDGTHVWLNAASKLRFPLRFLPNKDRKVELTGEAYFEVARQQTNGKFSGFTVKTSRQLVRVLGTHFNVETYPDDSVSRTTLIEGSVQINGKVILRPGEQASVKGEGLAVKNVDTEFAVAWKNNKFMFEQADIRDIMKQVERWYNVEVTYEGPVTKEKFGGSVSRFDHVSKVLDILELTGNVNFKIEGRRIIVTQ